jgi:hypothetical protein
MSLAKGQGYNLELKEVEPVVYNHPFPRGGWGV